jgi:hypothetical protein
MGYENASNLMTSEEKTAAAALAGLTTGAIARKKSDGTVEDGPLDFTCLNNFDPAVTGQAAPLRSTMVSLDGLRAWHKVGVADTCWRSLLQTPATVTASAAASALDALVSIGLTQMATVSVRGYGAAGAWGVLRIGGDVATLVSGQQAYGLGSVVAAYPVVAAIAVNASFQARFVVSSAQEISSGVYYRAVRGYYQSPEANYCGEFSHLINCGAVAADKGIGLGAGDNAIEIGTKITVIIDEDALNPGL